MFDFEDRRAAKSLPGLQNSSLTADFIYDKSLHIRSQYGEIPRPRYLVSPTSPDAFIGACDFEFQSGRGGQAGEQTQAKCTLQVAV